MASRVCRQPSKCWRVGGIILRLISLGGRRFHRRGPSQRHPAIAESP